MHITLATVGSRGDVQPYIALGDGLRAAGHSVCIATHEHFEARIRERGLDFSPVVGDPRTTVESELGLKWLESGKNVFAFARYMVELMAPMMTQGVADCLKACTDADLVLYSMLAAPAAQSVAEKLEITAHAAFLQPATPTGDYPSFAYPIQKNLGRVHNRLSYSIGEQMFWWVFRSSVNRARNQVLDLPNLPLLANAGVLRKRGVPIYYGYSPAVLPRPEDWSEQDHVTGYWFLDQTTNWEPPEDLLRFLDSGPPPVYVGFGSMHAKSPAETTAVVVESLDRIGLRGIVLSGWGALSDQDLPEYVYHMKSVPHDWLFPKVAAVVHHGGAGTTAAGLRAGKPTLVTPFFGDQFFWGGRLAALGVGPEPIPIRDLTVDRLADALKIATTDERMIEKAETIGAEVRSEDGIQRVVELLGKTPAAVSAK